MEDVVVVGAGQAGLAVAYCLRRRNIDPLVLEATKPGESWRQRYDSLVLFTPSQYSALPGTPFPLPADRYPTKDQVADYLAAYARGHRLRVLGDRRVITVRSAGDAGFTVRTADGGEFAARRVVVATGALQRPALPGLAAHLDPSVHQLHSSAYRRPGDLPPGRLAVVGAGNSGAQIAEELSRVRAVTVAFERLPMRLPQRLLGRDIFWWLLRAGVMDRTASPARSAADVVGSIPLIGSRLPGLLRRGRIARRGRVADAVGRRLLFSDGTSLEVDVVIWATGYRNDFSWIEVDGALDEHGHPIHARGVARVPGLFFIGLPGLHTKGSAFLGFVGRDAEHLALLLGGGGAHPGARRRGMSSTSVPRRGTGSYTLS